jgi:hypothetical protein
MRTPKKAITIVLKINLNFVVSNRYIDTQESIARNDDHRCYSQRRESDSRSLSNRACPGKISTTDLLATLHDFTCSSNITNGCPIQF